MKKIGLLLIIFFSFIMICNAETKTKKVMFSRCVDGDTAVFIENDEEVKYRFLAIDTPETVHPTKKTEEYGKDASEYTCNKLTNAKEIKVEYETKNKTDKYGRSLAWIWIDGSLLQKELVEVGYAEVAYIYGNYKYTESLCLVQAESKKENIGIWDGKREEGYCSTLDLSNSKSLFEESLDDSNDETEEKKNTKIDKELNKKIKKIDEATKKMSKIEKSIDEFTNFLFDDNSGGMVLTWLFVGIAVLSVFLKKVKK